MNWRITAVGLCLGALLWAQVTASIHGTVVDPRGEAVEGATVTLENQLTGYRYSTLTDGAGEFHIANIPLHSYELKVTKTGFGEVRRQAALRTNVPQDLKIQLEISAQESRVEVHASESTTLVDPEGTGTRTELNAASIERMPVQPGARGLESVLLSMPGFAANANGAIHPRGAHNQMTFVIDGMPISDQLTGAFANAVDPAIVQSVELFTGNVPAEFGNKLSGVAVITTRSGLGSGRKFAGSTQVSAAEFGTLSQITQVAGGGNRFGYFASINALKSNRYLDQVSLDNLHNAGNSERAFARIDYLAGPSHQLRANFMAGRSSFQLANLRSQHASGQDQRQMLRDAAFSLGWLNIIDARTTWDTTVSYRTSIAQLFPSAGDTPVTAAQARHLSALSFGTRWNRQQGRHTLRAGVDYQHFPLSENFSFAITDEGFNDPGSSDFVPTLLAHDLSRGGIPFQFSGKASGNMYTAFAQDTVRMGRWTATLGLRFDEYRFLARGAQWQPRVGLAFHIPETSTVLRASYNRTYQTPPNENLLMASSEDVSRLAPPAVREALGTAFLVIRPERQNVFEAGLQQAFGRWASVNASVYHKNSRDMQDNDNFLNTGIIFPTSLAQSRTNGAEARVTILPLRRLSGSLSLTHYHTTVTPPFTGGLFLGSAAIDALSAGPFVIDHDQKLGAHGMAQYYVRRHLWVSAAARYDSGLVSNPSDPAEVAIDPDYFDLLPYVNLESSPPRVRARTLVDVAAGYEHHRDDRRAWDLVVQVSNLGNTTALYNFQSIFVGTRLVQPRTMALKFRWYF